MTQGNLPQRGYNNSDEPVREFFDTYYQNKLEFPIDKKVLNMIKTVYKID